MTVVTTRGLPALDVVSVLSVAQCVAGSVSGRASDGQERDEEGERDREGEGQRDVSEREGERNVEVGHGLDHPHQEALEQVADGDRDDPPRDGEHDGLAAEDAADVSGTRADRAEDSDLACTFDDARCERTCEARHADRDDQEADYREGGRDRPVACDLVREPDVFDLTVDWVAVCGECVLDARCGGVDRGVFL